MVSPLYRLNRIGELVFQHLDMATQQSQSVGRILRIIQSSPQTPQQWTQDNGIKTCIRDKIISFAGFRKQGRPRTVVWSLKHTSGQPTFWRGRPRSPSLSIQHQVFGWYDIIFSWVSSVDSHVWTIIDCLKSSRRMIEAIAIFRRTYHLWNMDSWRNPENRLALPLTEE